MNTENVTPTTSKQNDNAQAFPLPSSRHPVARILKRVWIFCRPIQRWLAAHSFISSWLPAALQPWFVGYLLAVVLQVLILIIIELFLPVYPAFSIIEAPVLFVELGLSFVWGSGPGILATLLATILLVFLVMSPNFPFEAQRLEDGISIVLYLGIGLMSALMVSQAQRMKTNALLTRQKEAETNRLYDLFRQVPIPISVLHGPDYRFAFINPRTQQVMGNREVLGKPIREVLPEYGPQGIFNLLDQVYTTGEPLTVQELRAQTMHYNEDGPPSPIERYYNVVYQPLRAKQGEVDGIMIFNIDVTERKHLELRLRQTEQQTRESLQALLVLAEALVSIPITGDEAVEAEDLASTLEDVAHRLTLLIRSVLNCKRVSITILDQHTHQLRSLAVVGLPAEQEKLWRERRPGFHLSNQVAGTSLEAQFSTGNVVVMDMQDPSMAGQPNPYAIKMMLLAPMRIGTRLIGVLALDHAGEEREFTDAEKALAKAVAELAALILERERLLEDRAENQANVLALQEANHLKDEFIGIAGHELRTPLTTIKASVQLTRRQLARLLKLDVALSPEAEKLISTMETLLDRAERQIGLQNRLVNDLLDISRIETGRLELHPALGDLLALIHEVVEDQQALTPERDILFEHNIHTEALVLVDADRLRQVMTNYLSNALKYSAADQPVFVRIVLLETEVRVEVEDRGPGLTEAQQQPIWERFYRVPGIEVKSGSGVGLGLGLHISRMIIERHSGHVGVRSAKGHGSTFWLTLPRAE